MASPKILLYTPEEDVVTKLNKLLNKHIQGKYIDITHKI